MILLGYERQRDTREELEIAPPDDLRRDLKWRVIDAEIQQEQLLRRPTTRVLSGIVPCDPDCRAGDPHR